MRKHPRLGLTIAAALLAAGPAAAARAENLQQAWSVALTVNQGLQAQQSRSASAGLNASAARTARLPTLRTLSANAFLTNSPNFNSGSNTSGSGSGSGTGSGSGSSNNGNGQSTGINSLFGNGQRDIPVSLTYASLPLYTGGRLKRGIDQADATAGSQRAEEFRTALDLKLTVAEAYVGVLRAQKALGVARSNVEQLSAFARDVRNRRAQGLAIRSDELAAEVSLANARLSEIQARTTLESAWATYNRYLCRPLATVVPLEELASFPATNDLRELAAEAVRAAEEASLVNEGEVASLTGRAMQARPELASLGQQARALSAQADVTRAGVKPQVNFNVAYLYLGGQPELPGGIGAAAFTLDWLITDFGTTRRRAQAYTEQERAALRSRADTAADIALEVRTRWLTLLQARRSVPVTRLAIAQAQENIKVITDRYRQQLSTYTEVLDAETRRVTSLNNFYNAVYDESLAQFRLRRSVGDL